MEREPSPDVDDDFSEIYKEYTGPPRLTTTATTTTTVPEKAKVSKRSHTGSDEEEETRDPNAVPTDFTSREAKVWEAKSKATERNWKKRKEEEMICKICGESGHFTQGCPSTLGANRKSQDFFERVPAREGHVKALFTEKVISKIEKDVGCKIKMDEKFIIVSGKDKLCLSKGVDAVHKIKEEGNNKKASSSTRRSRSRSPDVHKNKEESNNKRASSSTRRSRSRSPDGSRVGSRVGRSEPQRSFSSPRKVAPPPHKFGRQEKVVEDHVLAPLPHKFGRQEKVEDHVLAPLPHKFGRQEKVVEDHVREDLQKLSRGSPRAYGVDGPRGRPSHSRSPGQPAYANANVYDGHTQNVGSRSSDGWSAERRGSDVQSSRKFDHPPYPQTLEELELEYKRDAMELARIRDKEEDEENYKHRESTREMRESYMKKLATMRGMHAKQWDEFLQQDIQKRQRSRQHMLASNFSGYNRPAYSDYDRSSGNSQYAGGNIPVESKDKYPYAVEPYTPTRVTQDMYGEFQRQRHDDYGKTYTRF